MGSSQFKPATSTQATNAAGSTSAAASGSLVPKSNEIASKFKPITLAPAKANIAASYEYDAYDLVLEYLLSQGHAETVAEAHYVMMEMDADMIGDIVEGAVGEFADKVASTVGSAVGTVQRAAREIPKQLQQKAKNVAGSYEYARQNADNNSSSGSTNAPRSREFSHGGKAGMKNPGPNFGR